MPRITLNHTRVSVSVPARPTHITYIRLVHHIAELHFTQLYRLMRKPTALETGASLLVPAVEFALAEVVA